MDETPIDAVPPEEIRLAAESLARLARSGPAPRLLDRSFESLFMCFYHMGQRDVWHTVTSSADHRREMEERFQLLDKCVRGLLEQLGGEPDAHVRTDHAWDALVPIIRNMQDELRRVYDLIWQYQQANVGYRRAALTPELQAAHEALLRSHRVGGWGTDGPPAEAMLPLFVALGSFLRKECMNCRVKPGSPYLCPDCLARRHLSGQVDHVLREAKAGPWEPDEPTVEGDG